MESNNQGQQPVRQSLGDGGKQKSTAAIIGILVGIAVVLLVVNGILKKDRSVKNEKVNEPTNTNQPVVIDNTNQPPEVITTTVDTSDWKRYRNKDIGFELKYPANWRVDESDSNVDIYSADYKMGLSVSIESTNKTLEQFVNEYNNLDQTSRILEEKEITISDSVPATKLKASTSLGIDSTYIYISYNSKRYLIRYYEPDEIHAKIVDSFRLSN